MVAKALAAVQQSVDRLDVLVLAGICLVAYGVAQLYSLSHAIAFAVLGLAWQMRRAVRRPE